MEIIMANKLETINVPLLGIVGKKFSGKDTIGQYLIDEHDFTRYAFADPIKEACQVIFGFTKEQCWGDQKEVMDEFWKITPRKLFQVLGTELFQYELPKYAPELADIGRKFWAYRFLRWYEHQIIKFPDINIVITDVRFPFEADILKELGGHIIKVVRPNQVYNDNHASETEMDLIIPELIINNDGTIDDLKDKVDQYLSTISV